MHPTNAISGSNGSSAMPSKQISYTQAELTLIKRINVVVSLILSAGAAAAAYAATHVVLASLVGVCLTGLSVILALKAIHIAYSAYQLHTDSSGPAMGSHHPYENRLIEDPLFVKLRMEKAAARAAATVNAGGSEDFETVFWDPMPAEFRTQLPISSQVVAKSEEYSEPPRLPKHFVATAHTQGRRPTMEDRTVYTSVPFTSHGKTTTATVYGVLDGHNGDEAADFVYKNIANTLSQNLSRFCQNGISDAGIYNALRTTFVELDRAICAAGIKEAGTTACIAVRINGDLYVANTGDSRAVLVDGESMTALFGGKINQLTEDQKPSIPHLMKGIRNRAGFVVPGEVARVFGRLAVARALGDWWSSHALGQSGHKVLSPLPKITKVPKEKITADSILTIACDGLWDVASSNQVGSVIQTYSQRQSDPATIAHRLAQAALDAGSTDNISIMLVGL